MLHLLNQFGLYPPKRGQENIAFETFSYSKKIALSEIDDPATLPIIFEAPNDCNWKDETIWHMVNPSLRHDYPDLDGLRQFAREAENRPGDRESFRQLNLNIWLDHSVDPFIDMDTYDKTAEPVNVPEGAPCWIGVDMSSPTDLTAVVACIVDENENYHILPFFFVPGDNLRIRSERDGVPYPQWAKEGFIHTTPGNVIDYRAVENCIRDLCSRFDRHEIGFDPAYAQPVMAPLMDEGFPVVTIRQGWVTQSPALNELERVILSRRFLHGGHPVLRWCFSNVAIHTDSAGNRMMHKGKSTDRIDGAAAAWMAVSRAAMSELHSVYDRNNWSNEMAYF